MRIEPPKIDKLTCLRCLAEWHPRAEKFPKQCAKCRSIFWNKPRVYKLKKK